MEVHRQSPIAPTREVFPLNPPTPSRRPIKSMHAAIKSPCARTHPFQSEPIQSCTPTRKVVRCRPIEHKTNLTQFDLLLESFNDRLAGHPTPTHSDSLFSSTLHTVQSSPIGDYSLGQQNTNYSTERESSFSIPETSKSFECEQARDNERISLNQSYPRDLIVHQCRLSNGVLPQTQNQIDDSASATVFVPLKLEDLLSTSGSSISSNEDSIFSPANQLEDSILVSFQRPIQLSLEANNTEYKANNVLQSKDIDYPSSEATRETASRIPLPSEAAILLSDCFYHRSLLCWGMRGLVHNVLCNRKLTDVAVAHHQLIRLKNLFMKWKRKAEKQRLKMSELMTVASELNRRRLFRRVFHAWKLQIYLCILKQLCEAYIMQKSIALLQTCFNQWVFQAALCVGDNILCTKLSSVWQVTLCRKVFNGWSKVTRISSTHRTVVNFCSKHLLQSCLSKWKRCYQLCHLQELRGQTQLQQLKKKKFFEKWRVAFVNKMVIMENSADQVLLSQAELTAASNSHTTADSDTHSIHCFSTSHHQLCTCLNPHVAKHIQDVKQKLEDLSASLQSFDEIEPSYHAEQCVGILSLFGEQINQTEAKVPSELDVNRSPIVTPPPEFAVECDTHLHYESHTVCFRCTPQPTSAKFTHTETSTAVSCVGTHPCNILFCLWKNYSRKKCYLRDKLNQVRNCSRLKRLRSILDTWKELSTQIASLNCLKNQLISTYRFNLLSTVLGKWKGFLRERITFRNLNARATRFHQLCHMQKHLRSWKDYCDYLTENKPKELRCDVPSHVWIKWRIALMRKRISLQSAYHNKQLLLKQVFTTWRVVTLYRAAVTT